MNDYIDEIHKVQLDLLEKFDAVCKELHLKYTLSSGSLLGAVRHEGFIPWDDDIDVAMVREDYEILVGKANSVLPHGYFFQHYLTEKNCPNVFAKLCNSNTTWIPHEYKKLRINHGIGMDIFPVDRVENPKNIKKIKRKTFIFLCLKNCCDFSYIGTIRNPYKKFVSFFVFLAAKIIGRKRIIAKADAFNMGTGKGEWTTADVQKRNKLIPYSVFETYEDIVFEGKPFSCIKDRETYLEIVYGKDYMSLPPEKDRVCHVVQAVDVNTPYVDYINKRNKEMRECKR